MNIERNKVEQMQEITRSRNVERLVHFTQVENLPSTIENGLIGRISLKKKNISYHINDQLRLDYIPDAICCFISFPNYKLFYRLRQLNPNTDWAIICIKPEVLWLKNAYFVQ